MPLQKLVKEGGFLYQEAHKIVELFEYTWLDTRNQEGPGVFRRESYCISLSVSHQKLVKEGITEAGSGRGIGTSVTLTVT